MRGFSVKDLLAVWRLLISSLLAPQIYLLDRIDLDFSVILLPSSIGHAYAKLLPEGRNENDIHFHFQARLWRAKV